MPSKQKPLARKFGLTIAAAAVLTTTFAGLAQAQYAPYYYGYYAGDLTRYNTPAEIHRWYDRGNTDFNS
jgi:hypothetical protein